MIDRKINWNSYVVTVKSDDFEPDVINIAIYEPSMGHDYSVFQLKIKGLWSRIGEGFNEGDYYQAVMNKETMFKVDKHKSYAALAHEFFLAHSADFTEIKNIYSSDITGHPEEAFGMSTYTLRFWKKQMEKEMPQVQLMGSRYRLTINEQ